MPSVKIGTMNKKINSTKQSFSGTSLSCKLKEPCSMQSPVFIVQGLSKGTLYNYASFEGRYYWVDDVVYLTNDIQEVHCSLDALATYKSSIQNSSGLIRFGPKSFSSDLMDDPRFGPDVPWNAARNSVVIPGFDIFDPGGAVILTVVAATDFTTNGVCQYVISYTEVMNYLTAFGSTIKTDMNGSNDVKEAIINMVIGATGGGNFTDNIKSMIWVPFAVNTVGGLLPNATVISEMGIGGYRVSGSAFYWAQTPLAIKKDSGYISIPWHADTNTHRFLRGPKYTSLTLCHPCGSVDIDTTCLIDQSALYYTAAINALTGDYYIKIKENQNDDAEPLAYAQGNVALNIMGMIAGGGTVGGNVLRAEANLAKNVIMPMFTPQPPSTTTSVQNRTITTAEGKQISMNTTTETTHSAKSSGITKNFMLTGNPPTSCSATLGGNVLNLYQTSTFSSQFYIQLNAKKPKVLVNTSDYDSYCDEYGWPINNYLPLSSITGYVEAADISVNPTGTPAPNDSLLSSLNSNLCSGIYIE